MKRLVLASNNAGKLREFSQLLAPFDFEVLPQSAFAIPEAAEVHCTFVENALAKARHAAQLTGLAALADDSGLCVDALDGAPGVYSTPDMAATDARNNEKLLAALTGQSNRRARFVCVLALVRHAADPQPLFSEGEWRGEILDAPRGSDGFGYDPLFLVPGLGLTAAELAHERKNAISHRGKALAALIARLRAAA